jgi:ribosome-associated toxin RatA of RatAB toxin-antitoxin module
MVRKTLKVILIFLAVDVVLVMLYGLYQYPKAKGLQHLVATRVVEAPSDQVWDIISDVGNYEHVTGPGIQRVDVLSGSGLGMIREGADPEGIAWEEVCTLWEPGKRFKFEVNTQKDDYAYPFNSLSGDWQVVELGPTTSRIEMDFAFEFKNPFISGFFLPFAMKEAVKDTEYILDNWQRMAEDN